MKRKPLRFRRALALLLSLLLLGAMGSTALAAETVNITGTYYQTDARAMLKDINDFRTGSETWYWNESDTQKIWCSNLPTLTYDYTLERIAMLRAAEITILWGHTRPDGTNWYTAFEGTDYTYVGENLAKGAPMKRSVAMDGLKETDQPYKYQGHRRAMLNAGFSAVGVAHFRYNGYDYWVQEFGTPALNTSPTAPADGTVSVAVNSIVGGGSSESGSSESDSGSSGYTSKVSLTLKWTRDKNADGYQLQYATNKKFTKNKKTVTIKKNKTTKYTIKNQKSGRTYYMRVRSYKKSGKKTRYSKWSNTVVFET